ncbi:MAG: HAD family hydrolase [Gammaproteobacteria bacterium]
MARTIAIFDLDGTITRRDTYLPFLFMCAREIGVKPPHVLLAFHLVRYSIGAINNQTLKEAFLSKFLAGVHLKDIEAISERFVEQLLEREINPRVSSALQEHLRQKHRVILATASFDLYITHLARKLGISEAVCTKAEVRAEKLTGRILGENCHGLVKLKRLEEILGERDWDDCVFYTDHHSDLPVLKKARRGYLVNPGTKTQRMLKDYNFQVLK